MCAHCFARARSRAVGSATVTYLRVGEITLLFLEESSCLGAVGYSVFDINVIIRKVMLSLV